MNNGTEFTELSERLFGLLHLGSYSIEKHLIVAGIGLLLITGCAVIIARFRSAQSADVVDIIRDIGIGVLCGLSIIAFPGIFFFIGRAYWKASSSRFAA